MVNGVAGSRSIPFHKTNKNIRPYKKLLELTSQFRNYARCKINIRKPLGFLRTSNEQSETEIKMPFI